MKIASSVATLSIAASMFCSLATQAHAQDKHTNKTTSLPTSKPLITSSMVDSAIKFYGVGQEVIPKDCGGEKPRPTKLIKIPIKGNLKNIPRRIRVRTYNSSTDTPSDPSSNMPQSDFGTEPLQTRYDLDLKNYWEGADYIAVKVIIKDPDITFWDDEHSVVAADKDSLKMFCGRKSRTIEIDEEDGTTTRWEVLKFHIKNLKTTGNIGRLNIDLFFRDSTIKYSLPVVIDPMIKNNG